MMAMWARCPARMMVHTWTTRMMMVVVPATRQCKHEHSRDYGDNEFFHG